MLCKHYKSEIYVWQQFLHFSHSQIETSTTGECLKAKQNTYQRKWESAGKETKKPTLALNIV